MRTRHAVAVSVIAIGMLLFAACGDDNDIAFPTPTATQAPPPTTPPTPPPTTPASTSTPTAATPVQTNTPTSTPEESPINFSCDVRTAFTCVGGPNAGDACDPTTVGSCGSGTCMANSFFCKGGPNEGNACQPRTTDCDPGGVCVNSDIQICTQLACPIVSRPVSAAQLDFTCSGAVCTARLISFRPVLISGIGLICVSASDSTLTCDPGALSCDANGPPLDIDLVQDHNIGACNGNEQCETMCQTYCGDRAVANSGCDGYCDGGTRANMQCNCDRSGPNCQGLDCPEGSCNGRDNAPPQDRNVCGCQCLDIVGPPSQAGALLAQISAQIVVEAESDPNCGDGPILLTLPPQCIPLTTETSAGVLLNANNQPGVQIPPTGQLVDQGSPVPCTQLQSNNLDGLNLVSNISFFGSTLGDLEVQLDWFCR